MRIGIVGLGLIGGSLAKAFAESGVSVYGSDSDDSIVDFAMLAGVIENGLNDTNIPDCDYIFIAIPPRNAIEWLEENSCKLSSKTVVIDCCGTKRNICEVGFSLADEFGFTFVGGHPMAGSHKEGFKSSSATLFNDSTFVVVLNNRNDINLLQSLKQLLSIAGFRRLASMTAEEHDRVIAFTSQLTHIVSSAMVKSGTAVSDNCAITGGSFRDMTRVASLNENMWTELCMDDRDNLLDEIDSFIGQLGRYRNALVNGDAGELSQLFADGSRRKNAIDEIAFAI